MLFARRLIPYFLGNLAVAAVFGCNAIVGNEDIVYTDPTDPDGTSSGNSSSGASGSSGSTRRRRDCCCGAFFLSGSAGSAW